MNRRLLWGTHQKQRSIQNFLQSSSGTRVNPQTRHLLPQHPSLVAGHLAVPTALWIPSYTLRVPPSKLQENTSGLGGLWPKELLLGTRE